MFAGIVLGHGGRGDRHAPAPPKDVEFKDLGSWSSTRSTGSACPRRSASGANPRDRRADPHRNAHPAHPQHVALWVRDLSVIETPPVDRLPVETVVAAFSRRRHQGGASSASSSRGRPGVLRAQPRAVARLDDHASSRAWSRRRGWSWATARWAERELESGDGQVRGRPGRRAGLHRHRGVGAGHPGLEHHHHQPGRPVRPGPALPAPGTGGAGAAAGLRLPAGPGRRAGGRARPSAGSGCSRS